MAVPVMRGKQEDPQEDRWEGFKCEGLWSRKCVRRGPWGKVPIYIPKKLKVAGDPFQAFFFDCDLTLLNSEPLHKLVGQMEMLKLFGFHPSEIPIVSWRKIFAPAFGLRTDQTSATFSEIAAGKANLSYTERRPARIGPGIRRCRDLISERRNKFIANNPDTVIDPTARPGMSEAEHIKMQREAAKLSVRQVIDMCRREGLMQYRAAQAAEKDDKGEFIRNPGELFMSQDPAVIRAAAEFVINQRLMEGLPLFNLCLSEKMEKEIGPIDCFDHVESEERRQWLINIEKMIRVEEIWLRWLRRESGILRAREGVMPLIDRAHEAGKIVVVVSSSNREIVESFLEILGIEGSSIWGERSGRVAFVIGCNDLDNCPDGIARRPKPSGDAYRLAMDRVNENRLEQGLPPLKIEEVVGIEDNGTGAAALCNAGMTGLVIPFGERPSKVIRSFVRKMRDHAENHGIKPGIFVLKSLADFDF